ncbi:hypothetical protein [Collimonas pratensis]|nr:hypothetical protein [Collimonas pratensis]
MGLSAGKPQEYWLAGLSECCIMVHFQFEKYHNDAMVQSAIYLFRRAGSTAFKLYKTNSKNKSFSQKKELPEQLRSQSSAATLKRNHRR